MRTSTVTVHTIKAGQDQARTATIECIDQGREWSEYDARTGSSASTHHARAV